jgi:hypothetical protein
MGNREGEDLVSERNFRTDESDDSVSLAPLVRTLWGYRRLMLPILAGTAVLCVIFGLWFYVARPAERHASLEFRLVFEGADRSEYPNGLRFARSEIISAPVLSEVFEKNDLSRYSTYDEFRTSFFILESSRELELLNYEYASKLAETRLTPVDRARLEEEFRQRREALSVPQYTLSFMAPRGQAAMPESLIAKVLNDVLGSWAEQVAARKGVLRYQVNVLTTNVLLREFVGAEDYLVRVDILRDKINRILENMDLIGELPGATVIRAGERQVSLAEIRANLYDVLRFRVEPLTGTIRSLGLTRDPDLLRRYLENRLFQVQLNRKEAESRVAVLQESLRRYVTERAGVSVEAVPGAAPQAGMPGATGVIPQFGESFLDRLVALAGQNDDTKYRQDLTDRIIKAGNDSVTYEKEAAYYETMMESVRRLGPTMGRNADPAAIRQVEARIDEVFNDTIRALEQVHGLYEQLSRQNLNPRTNLYSIASPFTLRTVRGIELRTIALYSLLILFAVAIALPIGCLAHHFLAEEGLIGRKKPAPARAEAPAPKVQEQVDQSLGV